tara:strand:- start:3186 stop:4478 length:1293 start_codon:yes stop_codon:yes gene_type:complete
MPILLTISVFAAFYALSFYYMKKTLCLSISFIFTIIFIVGLRFLFSSTYEISFLPMIGGLSLISLHTLLSLILMMIIVPKTYFKHKYIGLFYIYIILMFLSAFYNGIFSIALPDILKFIYLLLFMMALAHFVNIYSSERLMKALITLILPVIFLQVLSIVFGYAKDTEADGSISYIGSYSHEAVFSFVCLIGIYLSCFLYVLSREKKWLLCVSILLISIYFANYRTTILASLPVIFFICYLTSTERLSHKYKLILKIVSTFLVAIIIYKILSSERFADIVLIFDVFDAYLLDPAFYDRSTIQIFSGRLYFWAQFYQEYLQSSPMQKIIGSGSSAYIIWAEKYAHNQFVSIIYELGLIGFIVINMIFFRPYFYYFINKGSRNKVTKTSLLALTGMVILCQGTMPLWSIEGSICFSIIFMMFNNFKFSCAKS